MGAAGQLLQHPQAVRAIDRLAEYNVVENYAGIGREHRKRLSTLTNRECLFARHPNNVVTRFLARAHLFIDMSGRHGMWHADLR